MELEFDKAKYSLDSDGAWLMLRIPSGLNAIRQFLSGWKDKPHIAKLFEKRNRRSLNANAYAWVLMEELAASLNSDKDSVYLEMLRRYGAGETLEDGTKVIFTLKKNIPPEKVCKYHAVIGTSFLNGGEFVHYRALKGSSQYDTKEMSVFIDGIVSECKELEIETATPEELALMKSRWDDAQTDKSA